MNKRNVGIALSYVSTILNMICGLFLSSYLLRMLGDTEYGLYQTVSSFTNYLVLLEFGIGTVMTRTILVQKNAGEEHRIKNTVSTLWSTALFLGLIILLVSGVFGSCIGVIYQNTMSAEQVPYAQSIFAVITVYLLASFFNQAISGVLLGMANYTYARIMDVIRISLRTLTLTCAIFFRPLAIVIALVDATISVICFVVTYCYIKKKYKIPIKFKYFDKKILKESVPLCIALLMQTFVNQANNSVGKFLIGIMVSLESVAIYSVAQYIFSVFSSLSTIPITMYMPQVAKSMSEGLEGKELTKTLVKPSRLIAFVGGMICGGFFAVGQPFIELVYGAGKAEAWMYALMLMLPMYLNMTSGIVVNVLDVANKRIVRSYILLGTTLLNIVMSAFALPRYGIIGAVVSAAISTLLGQVLIMNTYYAKQFGLKILFLYKEAYKGLLEYILIATVIAFVVAQKITNHLVALLCGGTIFVIISCGGMAIYNWITKRKHNKAV